MKPLSVLEIFLIIGTANLVSSELPDFTTAATPETNVTLEEEKLLLECKNSDYRTYIKCLKRQKRQHHRPDEHGDFDHQCLESCLKKCGGSDHEECDKKCAHCLKRTRHRHQIITEYETECTSGECRRRDSDTSGLPSTNITTSIDINNIINTGNNQSCCATMSCVPPSPCPPTPVPPGGPYPPGWPYPHPPGGPYPPYHPYPPHQPYPSPYPPYGPQLTLVPQLTLGLGLGFSGGFSGGGGPCPWPPCPSYHTSPSGVDCSGCGNPFLKLKCDVSCYVAQGDPRRENPCQSPHCVGGKQ